MKIDVTMTEQATYSRSYTVEEFAALVGCEPTEEAIQAVLDDDCYSSDYGVDGATDLLDDILEHLDCVSERDWILDARDEADS